MDKRLFEINNCKCILVDFIKENKCQVGYLCWLNEEDEANIDNIIKTEKIINVKWPDCDIKSAKNMMKLINKAKFNQYEVKVLARGDWIEVRNKLMNLEKFGKLKILKERRKNVAKKKLTESDNSQEENDNTKKINKNLKFVSAFVENESSQKIKDKYEEINLLKNRNELLLDVSDDENEELLDTQREKISLSKKPRIVLKSLSNLQIEREIEPLKNIQHTKTIDSSRKNTSSVILPSSTPSTKTVMSRTYSLKALKDQRIIDESKHHSAYPKSSSSHSVKLASAVLQPLTESDLSKSPLQLKSPKQYSQNLKHKCSETRRLQRATQLEPQHLVQYPAHSPSQPSTSYTHPELPYLEKYSARSTLQERTSHSQSQTQNSQQQISQSSSKHGKSYSQSQVPQHLEQNVSSSLSHYSSHKLSQMLQGSSERATNKLRRCLSSSPLQSHRKLSLSSSQLCSRAKNLFRLNSQPCLTSRSCSRSRSRSSRSLTLSRSQSHSKHLSVSRSPSSSKFQSRLRSRSGSTNSSISTLSSHSESRSSSNSRPPSNSSSGSNPCQPQNARSETPSCSVPHPPQQRFNRDDENQVGVQDLGHLHNDNNVRQEEPLEMLKAYKPKLYKLYKRMGLDLCTGFREEKERYSVADNKIYLGLNIEVGQKTWRIMNYKTKKSFLRDLGRKLWKKHQLANRCLIKQKVRNVLPGRSPVKICTPKKLDLYLSLFEDYLNKHPKYSTAEQEKKDVWITAATESLSIQIRDERQLYRNQQSKDSQQNI